MREHFRRVFGMFGTLAMSLCVAGCASMYLPVSDAEIDAFASQISEQMQHNSEPAQPLSVDQAVAAAQLQNHTLRVRELEASLGDAKAQAAFGAMLPRMVAENEHTARDKPSASRSATTSPFITSSDRSVTARNMTITWSPIDMGLSFLRARQGLDKASQLRAEIRRVESRISEETRQAFWRVVALEIAEARLQSLNPRIDKALSQSERAMQERDVDPLVAINLQRDLLNLLRELGLLRTFLAPARGQLEQLIGSGPVTVDHRLRSSLEPPVARDIGADVETALRLRPEVRQAMYDLRISADEMDAVVLEALPSAAFSASHKSDSNSFLRYAHWNAANSAFAMNITNLLRLHDQLETVEAQRQVVRQMAVVTAASIAVQVRVASDQIDLSQRLLRDAQRLSRAQRRLLRQVRAAVVAGKSNPQGVLREELASLIADVRQVLAFAERDNAIAAYHAARGDTREAPVRAVGK